MVSTAVDVHLEPHPAAVDTAAAVDAHLEPHPAAVDTAAAVPLSADRAATVPAPVFALSLSSFAAALGSTLPVTASPRPCYQPSTFCL